VGYRLALTRWKREAHVLLTNEEKKGQIFAVRKKKKSPSTCEYSEGEKVPKKTPPAVEKGRRRLKRIPAGGLEGGGKKKRKFQVFRP